VQKSFQKPAKDMHEKSGKHKSILDPVHAAQNYQVRRYVPSKNLSSFVEHYWIVRWDLRGQPPYETQILPFPSINLAFTSAEAKIAGITTGKYSYEVRDAGVIFGAMFKPGGFYPFFRHPLAALTDKTLPLSSMFPEADEHFRSVLLSLDDRAMVIQVENLLLARKPKPDQRISLVNKVIDAVIADRTVCTVQSIAKRFGMPERTLQHLFQTYVGVGLKWIIMRYRLQDAAELAVKLDTPHWAKIAAELGYSSQSHFTRDFKKIIGQSPTQYAKATRT
jgi:AraC-like DNA-binding protein